MSASYEEFGPTRVQVVKSLTDTLIIKYPNLGENKIKKIIEESIPIEKTDFGSWRAWATFGIETKYMKCIIENIKKEINEV